MNEGAQTGDTTLYNSRNFETSKPRNNNHFKERLILNDITRYMLHATLGDVSTATLLLQQPVRWLNTVGQSEHSHTPFGPWLQTVCTVSPADQI